MECPSCGFQNLPGLQQCGRCQGTLSFDAVDVRPYRAADPWVRRLQRWRTHSRGLRSTRTWLGQGWREVRQGVASWVRGINRVKPAARTRMKWVIASIVPGLGHILSGRRRKGRYLLAGWGLAVAGSLLFMSFAWSLFVAIALGIQVYAIVDCLFHKADYAPRPVIILSSLVVFGFLMYGYWGAGWVFDGVAHLEQLNVELQGNLLHRNDVLLFPGRWFAPPRYSPGDVVLYYIGVVSGQGWYVRDGLYVDRILAVPGDRLVFKQGTMTVNGRPLPLNRGLAANAPTAEDGELVVPPDSYFIYPALASWNIRGGYRVAPLRLHELYARLTIVPHSSVRGRVRMVVNPLTHVRVF